MKKRFLFWLFLLLSVTIYGEESFYFKRFSTENGLAQNTVFCILQDTQGFMWFGTKDGLCRYDGYRFKIFRHDKNNLKSIGNNFIRSIHQDETNDIWIGTDAGVYIYNIESETFNKFSIRTQYGVKIEREVNDIKQDHDGNFWFAVDWQGVFFYNVKTKTLKLHKLNNVVNAWNICIDEEDNVWIGTHGGGLNKFNARQSKFEAVINPKLKGGDAVDDIYRLYFDNYNELLIATATDGLKKYNLINKQLTSFIGPGENKTLFVRDIMRRSSSEIWIGTESGIFIYDEAKDKIQNLCHSHMDEFSLSDNAVYCMYKDREGGIWVGTYFGGVSYYPAQHTPFEKYYPLPSGNSMKGKRVREMQQDKNGRYWIGTEDAGLSIFDPNNNRFVNLESGKGAGRIAYHNVHGLMADDDKMWVGTFGHGLDIVDINSLKVVKHYEKSKEANSICDNSIFSIYKDRSGDIWIGTLYGLTKYDRKTDGFSKISFLGDSFIYDILQTSDGVLWFATLGSGLYQYNLRTNKWNVFRHSDNNSSSLPHDKIVSLFEDSKKRLWVATEGGGLSMYQSGSGTFKTYAVAEGLPNNVVYKILEDDANKLWFTTNLGLVSLNMSTEEINVYTTSNGLLSDQFNYKSGIKGKDGRLLFGGLNGFISFDQRIFTENLIVPPVYITDILINNQYLSPNDDKSILKKALPFGGEVHLNANQSSFNIDFAALSFTAPEKNLYVYMLEGFDKNWIFLKDNQRVYYSNIPPGTYTFKVKGSNNNEVWNEQPAEIKIIIHPPFYKSIWAYIIYSIIFICVFALMIYLAKENIRRRNIRKKEILDIEKEKELYNAKIAFFTNIAHEIRTPLSLIKGPLEYIMKESVPEKEREEQLEVIDRNTNRLLDLTNQLLDFRKTERESFKLNFVKTDIIQLIKGIYVRFNQTAVQKGINFQLNLSKEELFVDIDSEAITKILSNLFSNGIKFAESFIIVSLDISEDSKDLVLTIENDGQHIPEELKEKIFEPFFQIEDDNSAKVRSGTGLGLPLARSLAELHNGSLWVETRTENTNTFILTVPVSQPNALILTKTEKSVGVEEFGGNEERKQNKLTILLVEDDEDLLEFLSNILKKDYNTIKTHNGKDALGVLEREHVDLVITDIMMPIVDGLELCKEIKTNLNHSHIPVIILTAKTGTSLHIQGLEAGADAYIEKPFQTEYLLAQVSNLFSNRNKIKEAFVHSPYSNIGSIASTKADEQFLEKATEIIHKNLSDEGFNVDSLAKEMNMSRSSLQRKIKGISELTPNDFIILVRLKKAAEYLNEGIYRVNEICYVVGFSSSSYFSKSFKKHFGVSPRDFLKK